VGTISSKPSFTSCALASGLVSQEQIDQAIALLGYAPSELPDSDAADSESAARHQALAEKLIELGFLNPWQVQQLGEGRTRFHLGPYRILDSIGQGGMGQVFKAEHMLMGRVVAVKVLPRHKSTPVAIDSFQREMRAQAQLDHINLVRALDAGHDGNVYYLVTEYVEGSDLRRLVRRHGRISQNLTASIAMQAAQGLIHAHSKGLIHRDVKPGNVLVMPDGRAKISDLGLVGSFGQNDLEDPRRGKIVGTADYLSPEQIKTPDSITPASDIYSLGCTIYYAVTGKVPFPGGTTRDKTQAHCEVPPLDPRRLNPELTDEFVDLLADMMAKDVADRTPDMNQVIVELSRFCGNVPLPLPESQDPQPPAAARALLPPPISSGTSDSGGSGGASFGFESSPDPRGQDSPSQMSQGTLPVNTGNEETVPSFDNRQLDPLPRRLLAGGMSTWGWFLLAFGCTAVLALVIVILVKLF
jgi:serine/threonine protein kinase